MRVVLITILFFCMIPRPILAQPLDQYHWKNRVLLVFGDADHPVDSAVQKKTFEDNYAEFEERDVVIKHVKNDDDLYKRFNVEDGFVVVLIGKDGGMKAQWLKPVDAKDIFVLIDAMPMRQREMREQQ